MDEDARISRIMTVSESYRFMLLFDLLVKEIAITDTLPSHLKQDVNLVLDAAQVFFNDCKEFLKAESE